MPQMAYISKGETSLISLRRTSGGRAPNESLIEDDIQPFFQVSGQHQPWGRYDRLPNSLKYQISRTELAASTVHKLTALMFGCGVDYYTLTSEGKDYTRNEEVEKFIEDNDIDLWALNQCHQYRHFACTVPVYSIGKYVDKIVKLDAYAVDACRLGKPDKKRRVRYLYHSGSFGTDTKDAIDKLRLMERREKHDFLEKMRGSKNGNFTEFLSLGIGTCYPSIPWAPLFKRKGWAKVSREIPRIICSMMENQVSIKYHIEVSEDYFLKQMPQTWRNANDYEKNSLVTQLQKKIEDILVGVENTGKSLVTWMENDMGTMTSFVKVTAIQDPLKVGAWTPNNDQASMMILRGLMMDPSVGGESSNNRLGGSGSEKRVGAQVIDAALDMDRMMAVLKPLNFVSWYNNWGVKFEIKRRLPVTADQNREASIITE